MMINEKFSIISDETIAMHLLQEFNIVLEDSKGCLISLE